MIRAYNRLDDIKYTLVSSATVQLPPKCGLTILEMQHDGGTIRLRLIFSRRGEEFTVNVKKSTNSKFLDYYFYNWNSEHMTDVIKPLSFKFKEGNYIFNFATKINPFNNIRTIQYTIWEIS